MIDIDHFKSINDNFGHLEGDRILTEVAKILRLSVKNEGTIGRYGGDEFCIISELTDEVSRVYDENSTLTESNKSYLEDMEKLRSANMQLFLRVGENKTPDEINKDKTGVKDEPTPEPRKFESLFDDKGGLK